jgi:hypothetical protein
VKHRRGLAVAGGVALALVGLAALRIALGKSLGDWVAAQERARFEREVGPLDPAYLAAPDVAEGDNAVPAIVAAAAAIELSEQERLLLRDFERRFGPGDGRTAALDALLAARRSDLAALAEAARRPASSFGPRTELFHGAHVDLTAWLTAARLVAADGERALATDDDVRAEAALEALLGMTKAIRREPIAFFAVVGTALATIHLDLVRSQLERGADAATLARLAVDLESLRALPDARAVLHGEAVLGHDMLRRTPIVPRIRDTPRERLEALLWPWSEGHVEAGFLAGWRELADYARTPQARWPSIERVVSRRQGILRRWLDPTAPFETVRTLLFPDLLSIARRLQQLAAAEQLARLAVAVAAQASSTGALPASLAEFPEAAGPDAASGESPRYAVAADGAATLAAPHTRELVRQDLERSPAAQRHVAERRLRLLVWQIPPPVAATR